MFRLMWVVTIACGLFLGLTTPVLLANECPQDSTYTLDADFDLGTLVNVNHDTPDQLQLSQITEPLPFIWVAASARGTIIKINTDTGAILGEFLSSPDGRGRNPSRTTVDLSGAVWAGNRNEAADGLGSAVHIALVEAGDCVDRNGNGIIDTSTGLGDIRPWGNAGGVDDDGGIDTADDECIINYVRVNGSSTRTVAVTSDNNAWIGGYNFGTEHDHDLVHPESDGTGSLLASISPDCGGYGGVFDGNGILWSADFSQGQILRYNPTTDVATCIAVGTVNSYGLGIDSAGNIWNSSWGGRLLHKISPDGTTITSFPTPEEGSCERGVAVTPVDQNVWVANSCGNSVNRFTNAGAHVITISVGTTPTGVAVDATGKVWVTNQGSDNVMRIDPATNLVDLTVNLGAGAGPYNYSDMTGLVLLSTVQQGSWTIVRDGGEAGTEWARVVWNTEGCADPYVPEGTDLIVEVRAAESEVGLGSEAYVEVGNSVDISGIVGQFIQVRITFEGASDPFATPVLCDLAVEAICNEPPDCSEAQLSSAWCWPPNHKFSLVEVLGVTDPDGDPVEIVITGITQDEPVLMNGTGSGKTCPDGVMVDMEGDGTPDAAGLRCERAGNPKVPGNGRVYHVSFLASDGRGGECSGTVTWCVPHDQRPDATCVDDGPLYDSTVCTNDGADDAMDKNLPTVINTDTFLDLTPEPLFLRGDVNWDEALTLTDPIIVLERLYKSYGGLDCEDAADTNDDGDVDISDPIVLFTYLFLGGPPPAPPVVFIGPDPTEDGLGCE